jgi:flagellum-specific ATP synthase
MRLISSDQRELVMRFRRLMSVFEENRDLVSVGAYRPGANPELDDAILRRSGLIDYLKQDVDKQVPMDVGFTELESLLQ